MPLFLEFTHNALGSVFLFIGKFWVSVNGVSKLANTILPRLTVLALGWVVTPTKFSSFMERFFLFCLFLACYRSTFIQRPS